MLEPWQRALRNCVQQVPDESDLDYEPGVMPLQPIQVLLSALTPEQVVSLGWFALADVAVWPQVPSNQGTQIADALQQGAQVKLGAAEGACATVGSESTKTLLEFVAAAEARLQDPQAPLPDAGALLQVLNAVAQLSSDPDAHLREWFFRVIPSAAKVVPADARELAIGAFRCTIKSVAPEWDYEAGLKEDPADNSVFQGIIALVTPGRGGTELYDIGAFSNYAPQGRTINAELNPLTPIDAYRMGYLFQTTFMAYFLKDPYSGRFDTAVCTNKATGERWRYAAP